MSSCAVEDDEFIPCEGMKDALKYGIIPCGKIFPDLLVIGDNKEMVIEFCPFCAEQV